MRSATQLLRSIGDVERHVAHRAVGGDPARRRDAAVDDDLDRHLARVARARRARALQIPVRLSWSSGSRRSASSGCSGSRAATCAVTRHRPRPRQTDLAVARADVDAVDAEVDQVALAVGRRRSVRCGCPPPSDRSRARIELDVAAAQSDAVAVDAREVGLAADAGAEARVERVVPDVQLPRRRRVDGGDEVDGVVRHVDDVLVGADAVEARHLRTSGVVVSFTSRPQPECAKPTTAPCALAHCRIGRSSVGQSLERLHARDSPDPSGAAAPDGRRGSSGKPDTSTS